MSTRILIGKRKSREKNLENHRQKHGQGASCDHDWLTHVHQELPMKSKIIQEHQAYNLIKLILFQFYCQLWSVVGELPSLMWRIRTWIGTFPMITVQGVATMLEKTQFSNMIKQHLNQKSQSPHLKNPSGICVLRKVQNSTFRHFSRVGNFKFLSCACKLGSSK